jgi:hypothetical protein
MTKRSKLWAVGIVAAVSFYVSPAESRYCFWNPPSCTNLLLSCPDNFESIMEQSCFLLASHGHQRLCCEKMALISQPQTQAQCGTSARQWGTPGCPYPSFGSPAAPAPTPSTTRFPRAPAIIHNPQAPVGRCRPGTVPSATGTGCVAPAAAAVNRCPWGTLGHWPNCHRPAATCGPRMTGTPPNCFPVLH